MALTQKDVSSDMFTPDDIKTPRLLTIVLLTKSGGFKDAVVRVSRDLPSAHEFSRAFMLNKYPFLYTELAVTGVVRPPFPDTVYLAMAQKEPWDLKNVGLGLFKTLAQAEDGCRAMAAKDAGFTQFEVKTCVVQMGLTEDDSKYLDELNEQSILREISHLEQELDEDACDQRSK